MYRSEDTDRERSSIDYENEIKEGLHWLGIQWDNDTIVRQSEQSAVYEAHIQQLLDAGTAYVSEEPSKQDPSKTVTVVRLKNPNVTITFTDLIRGEITFDTTELGDFVIARSTSDALYHLTVVIDDARMGVTHVLRGEDHISNTPRQILIQEALGFPRPVYAHLPLILAPDRSKLSKRNGTVAINEYKEMGILPDALLNYITLLGWNPGTEQEVFTLPELIEAFSIESIQKGGAVFDINKLKWLNKQHLLNLTTTNQEEYVLGVFTRQDYTDTTIQNRVRTLSHIILERYHTQSDIRDALMTGEYDFLISPPQPTASMLAWKKDTDPAAWKERLQHVSKLLTDADFSSPESIKSYLWDYAEEVGKGEVLWPLRVALTGQERSPDPFTVAYTLGKEEAMRRIQFAYDKI